MPSLEIQTNATVEAKGPFVRTCSKKVCEILGKPEGFMMVTFVDERTILFGGGEETAAFMRLEAIGLPQEKTEDLSAALALLAEEYLKVPRQRLYIVFRDVSRAMWGWDGSTF